MDDKVQSIILEEIRHQRDQHLEMYSALSQVRQEVASLKARVSFYSGMMGFICGAIFPIASYFIKLIK